MYSLLFNHLPKEANYIRNEVFIKEQGFINEIDDIDKTATHIVLFFDNSSPVATCRVFWSKEMNSFILGRVAVLKEHRGRNFGTEIVKEAERFVLNEGGKELQLHSQCKITEFYKKLGYKEFGEIEYEEDCPHIWMRKYLLIQK